MVLHTIHCCTNTTLRVSEAFKPLTQVDVFLYFIDMLFGNALPDEFLHVVSMHLASTTVGMMNEHDLLNAKLIYADNDRAHHGVVIIEDDTASDLHHLHFTIFDAQCLWQHHTKSRVHTCDNQRTSGRFPVRDMLPITFPLNEATVVFQYIVYHSLSVFCCFDDHKFNYFF